MEYLTKEQIKELEYAGVSDIKTGRDIVYYDKYDEELGYTTREDLISPEYYTMIIDGATVVLDPRRDNIYDSATVYGVPTVWYGMYLVAKVIEMINKNKFQREVN